jgi:AraC-like DNA-binding protein
LFVDLKKISGEMQTNLFLTFIGKKINLSLLAIVVALLVVSYVAIFHKSSIMIFPSDKKYSIQFYTDINDGGLSEIASSQITDSILSARFILKPGFVRPYIGLWIRPEQGKFIDLSRYNKVEITASGINLNNMNMYIVSEDARVKNEKVYSSSSFVISSEINEYTIRRKNFKIPDWWYETNNFSPTDNIHPNWEKVLDISFATGLTPEVNQERQLSIYSVLFIRDNTHVIVSMLLIFFVFAFILFLVDYFKRAMKKKEITINYKPVNVEDKSKISINFLDYINQNFQNPELSLEEISLRTGINQRRISEGISAQYNCNVKTYINNIRIKEAQRLLKQSKLSISEIAYKVGFSSPNHFNRVFKAIVGENPTEFSHKKSK